MRSWTSQRQNGGAVPVATSQFNSNRAALPERAASWGATPVRMRWVEPARIPADDDGAPVPTSTPPRARILTPVPALRAPDLASIPVPAARAPDFELEIDVVLEGDSAGDLDAEIKQLVESNALFQSVASLLQLSDELARFHLCKAMVEAQTCPATMTAEALWFMVPRIERDVLVHYGDASIRRELLDRLLEGFWVREKREKYRHVERRWWLVRGLRRLGAMLGLRTLP